jgi:hypothetical protein
VTTLRCTAALLKRLRLAPEANIAPTGRLGDWSARAIAGGRRPLVLCTNERSLLCVVVHLAPMRSLLSRFATVASQRIHQLPIDPALIAAEILALEPTRLGRCVNRSVISTMHQFMYSAESWLRERPDGDLEELGLWLCDTPCRAISTHWPWLQAELLITGAVTPGRRPLKSPMHFL